MYWPITTSGAYGYNGIGFYKPALQNAFILGYVAAAANGQ